MKSVVDLKVKGAWGGAVHPRHWRELEEVKGARGMRRPSREGAHGATIGGAQGMAGVREGEGPQRRRLGRCLGATTTTGEGLGCRR